MISAFHSQVIKGTMCKMNHRKSQSHRRKIVCIYLSAINKTKVYLKGLPGGPGQILTHLKPSCNKLGLMQKQANSLAFLSVHSVVTPPQALSLHPETGPSTHCWPEKENKKVERFLLNQVWNDHTWWARIALDRTRDNCQNKSDESKENQKFHVNYKVR